MKKLSFLALAAVAFLFGACASDNDVATNDGNILEDQGVGYFKVNLNLPKLPSTRAEWNEMEELQSGALTSEWAVDQAIIVLFSGTNETTAKVVQVSTLVNAFKDVTPNNPDQVTQKNEEVVTLSSAALTSDNLYALAVINGTGIIEPDGSNLKINGTVIANATLADLQSEIAKLTAYTDQNKFVNASNHIFMTNAVLSNVKGGGTDPTASPALHILAPVNKSLITTTKAAAEAGLPAVDIYVERGVAKVTLDAASTYTAASTISAKGTATIAPSFEGWGLDNINSRSYILRKVPAVAANTFAWNYVNTKSASAEKYRFVGNYPVDAEYLTASAGYRTYWALDPNYDTPAGTDLLSPADNAAYETMLAANKTKVGDNNPIYCYENTFDVDRQSYLNTTCAIVKIKFNGGTTFYTVGADNKTLYPLDEVGKLVANALMGISDFVAWLSSEGALKSTIETSDLTVEWTTDAAGVTKVKDITLGATVFTGTKKVSTAGAAWTTWKTTIESQVPNIKRHVGGLSYYPVRIKHFGDDLTPWNKGEMSPDPTESTIDKIYPGTGDARNAAYLGRYGMVRNNWYVLHIDGILNLGYTSPTEIKLNDPTDPTTPDPDHPDDDLDDSFIKARINILSWAKRPQNMNLK